MKSFRIFRNETGDRPVTKTDALTRQIMGRIDADTFGRRIRSLGADIDALLERTKALHAATVKEADELRAQRARMIRAKRA
jgi:hypothetical protein